MGNNKIVDFTKGSIKKATKGCKVLVNGGVKGVKKGFNKIKTASKATKRQIAVLGAVGAIAVSGVYFVQQSKINTQAKAITQINNNYDNLTDEYNVLIQNKEKEVMEWAKKVEELQGEVNRIKDLNINLQTEKAEIQKKVVDLEKDKNFNVEKIQYLEKRTKELEEEVKKN